MTLIQPNYLFAILFVSSTPFHLIYAEEFIDCAKIENDLDRLSCYDKVSGREEKVESVESTSKWNVRTSKSDFKDTTDVAMTLQSENDVGCGAIYGSRPITLVLRCKENTTSAYLSTHCHLASSFGGYDKVEYRIDDKKAKTRSMDESTDSSALGLWSGRKAIPFVKELFGGEKLLVRFTPYGESPVTATFDITGIEEDVKQLRKECNW